MLRKLAAKENEGDEGEDYHGLVASLGGVG
jgi:hypothetical protein